MVRFREWLTPWRLMMIVAVVALVVALTAWLTDDAYGTGWGTGAAGGLLLGWGLAQAEHRRSRSGV